MFFHNTGWDISGDTDSVYIVGRNTGENFRLARSYKCTQIERVCLLYISFLLTYMAVWSGPENNLEIRLQENQWYNAELQVASKLHTISQKQIIKETKYI